MTVKRYSHMTMIDVADSEGPVLLLKARGHINTLSAGLFESIALSSIAETDSNVVIEASGVTYLSSAGMRVFLRLLRELKKAIASFAYAASDHT